MLIAGGGLRVASGSPFLCMLYFSGRVPDVSSDRKEFGIFSGHRSSVPSLNSMVYSFSPPGLVLTDITSVPPGGFLSFDKLPVIRYDVFNLRLF